MQEEKQNPRDAGGTDPNVTVGIGSIKGDKKLSVFRPHFRTRLAREAQRWWPREADGVLPAQPAWRAFHLLAHSKQTKKGITGLLL